MGDILLVLLTSPDSEQPSPGTIVAEFEAAGLA
jgi:hypothetical protein